MFNYPAVTYNVSESLATWTPSSVTVTTGQADPFGGTGAALVTDSSISAFGNIAKTVVTSRIGNTEWGIFLKNNTATKSILALGDGTTVVQTGLTWTNGVPTASINQLNPTLFTPAPVGNGWYYCRIGMANPVGATMTVGLYPDGGTVAGTGAVYAYSQNFVMFGYPAYQTIASDEDRDGTTYLQASSGVETAFTLGRDEILSGQLKWISQVSTDSPRATGYYGINESVGVNCSVKAWLQYGRTKRAFNWIPDYSNCKSVVSSYLVEPMKDGLALESDGKRSITFKLRNPNSIPYEGY